MSSGHVVIACHYFDTCSNTEEFPDECAPPSYVCDTCYRLRIEEG